MNDIKVLKKNIYIKREQQARYNKLKEELGQNEVLLHVNYSENYGNVKYRVLTLVTIPFRFSRLVVISVKLVTSSMKISQYQKQVTIHVLLLLHALIKFLISCGKSIIYY